LDADFQQADKELKELQVLKIVSENKYQELSLRYGHLFEASIGAEAVRNLLARINMGETIKKLLEEQQQVKAAQSQPAAFEILYNRYHETIFRYVYQRLDDKETAFDITQQVFMKALSNIKKYEYRGVPFSAWLYRIAQNELNSYFRKHKNERTVNMESATLHTVAEEMEEESLDDMYVRLTETISTLGEPDLTLMEMRFFEHRPFKEIGDIMGMTENNAKVKIYRIIDKLKKLLN